MNKPGDYIAGEVLGRIGDWSEDVLLAIKEAQKDSYKSGYNKALKDAVRNCTILNTPLDKVNHGGIDINSILKLKIK